MSVERDDWLPALPSGWAAVPAKSLFSLRSEKSRPDDVHLTPSQKYGVIPQSEYMEITGSRVVLNLVGADNMKHVEPGDFVIHLRSFQGGVEFSQHRGKVSAAYTVLTPTPLAEPRFFRWLLKSERYIQALQVSVDQLRDGQSIRYGDFAKIDLPLAPPDVQRRIADYLDRETATIDALIDKQIAHVGILRERRLAAQNRAVMGLDLDSELIDGEQVPVGWASGPIKRVLESLDSRRVPLNADERGARQGSFPYYGASGVIDSVDDYLFDEDLVLVGEDGANLLNRSTPLAFVAYGRYWVNNHAHVLRPKFGPAEFWAARIEALDVSPVVSGSAQPKLTADALMALRISWPEKPDDMTRIAEAINRETAKIDALIAKAERFIELAQERRAALITAAVTGQIEIPTED